MYTKKDYSTLKGMEGFSDKALDTHLALYEGYVNNVNKIMEMVGKLWQEKKTDSPDFAELRRRFGWEWNGMRMHELYFGNLGGNGEAVSDSKLYKVLEKEYGSFQTWKDDFLAVGKMRGIGWVVLCQDKEEKSFFNVWVNEHDGGHFAGTEPILVMDVFEHAFFVDYGKDRAAYLDAFMKNVDWQAVEKRLQ